MTLINLRVNLLKFLINLNERMIFERKLFSYYKKKSKKNVFIDIGANQGQTIDFF